MNFMRCFIYLSLIAFVFVGCDKIAETFKGSSKKETVKTSPATPSPKTKPAPVAKDTSVPVPDNVLAQVGTWTLTKEEFNDRLKGLKEVVPDFDTSSLESKKLVLEELVRQQLLVTDAQETGLANKKEIVDAVEEFKRTLLVREVANKLIEKVKVTSEEAEEYYNKNKEMFIEPAEYKIREIVAYTKDGAKEILTQVINGADFAEMAKTKSISKSASKGGDLGFLKELDPSMSAAVSTMEPGDISSIFKGSQGFYIVKLEEKKGGKPLEFAGIKADVITGLTQMKQQQVILDYLEQLSKKTTVKINEKALEE